MEVTSTISDAKHESCLATDLLTKFQTESLEVVKEEDQIMTPELYFCETQELQESIHNLENCVFSYPSLIFSSCLMAKSYLKGPGTNIHSFSTPPPANTEQKCSSIYYSKK